MGGDSDLSSTERTQQGTFTDTVLTDQTIAPPISKRKTRVAQYALATYRDINIIHFDIFTL